MTMLAYLRRWSGLASCVVLIYAAPALAEEAIHGEGADPMNATSVQLEQAQARFARAKQLFDAGDFEQALDEFKASRAIVASPNTRLYQARCLKEVGKTLEAYATYGRTMIEAMELSKLEARYGRTADAARAEREELEADLAFVKLNIHAATPDTKLIVNGEEIRRTAWTEPVVAQPGEVVIDLATPGFAGQTRTILLQPGETQELTLTVEGEAAADTPAPAVMPSPTEPNEPAPGAGSSLTPYAYTAAAVSAVGFGAFGAFGLSSKNKYDRLEAACVDGSCPANEARTLDDGRQEQVWANIGLAVGIVGAAAAVTLFVLDADDGDESVALVLCPNAVSVRGWL